MDQRSLLRTLTIGIDSILVPYIDRYLAQDDLPDLQLSLKRKKYADWQFHPSGDCLLSEDKLLKYLLEREEKSEVSSSLRMTFDMGHLIHGYLQETLIDMGFVKRENVEKHEACLLNILCEKHNIDYIKTGALVSGTIDLLDVIIPERGTWLIDIKSSSSSSFDVLESTSLYEKYKAQVNVYGDILDQDNMMILAYNKNDASMRELIIQRDEDLLRDIYGRWAKVAANLFEYHTMFMQNWSDLQLGAYLSGIIDGEGSVECREDKQGSFRRRVDIPSTEPAIINASIFAANKLEIPFNLNLDRKGNGMHKPLVKLRFTNRSAFTKLREIVDLAEPRKKKRLDFLVDQSYKLNSDDPRVK